MIQLLIYQQLMIIIASQNQKFVEARQNLLDLEQAKRQKIDQEISALRLKRIIANDLWKNHSLLGAIASGVFLFGILIGHNMMSRAVLCDSLLCENLRMDKRYERLN